MSRNVFGVVTTLFTLVTSRKGRVSRNTLPEEIREEVPQSRPARGV